jgi:hypothetical protein
MITSVFKKYTPINFIFVVILLLGFFLIFQFQDLAWTNSVLLILKKTGIFFLLLGSVFLTDFIEKKNGMNKNSVYSMFFFFFIDPFFPFCAKSYQIDYL